MSLISAENTLGTATGAASLIGTYLGPQGDSIAVFKSVQAAQPFTNAQGLPDSNQVTDFVQVFPNARPMKCVVRPMSKVMDHPLETGQIISDYKILLPVEVSLQLIVSSQFYKDTYAEISNLYSTSELLTVQTRASVVKDTIIMEMPDEERPDMFDVINIELKLKQVFIVQSASNFSPANPVQTDTQNNGQQSSILGFALPANSMTNNPAVVKTEIASPFSAFFGR